MTNRTKNIIIGIVAIILLLSISYFSCEAGKRSILKTAGTDTIVTVRIDTVQSEPIVKTLPPDTVTRTLPSKTIHDTLEIDREILPIEKGDTLKELKRLYVIEDKFNERNVYDDSTKVNGVTVSLKDTVTGNKIKIPRTWVIGKSDTATKTTVVLHPKKPLVVSLMASAMGNVKEPFHAQGGGFQLKLPSEGTYQAQIFRVQNQKLPMVQVTKTWPIFKL